MSIRIIIMGPPGVGKGTQANILKHNFNIPHLSTGEILRNEIKVNSAIGKISKNYIDNGLFVPDNILIKIIERYITNTNSNKGYILDGYPRNLLQVKDLKKLLSEIMNLIIWLSIQPSFIVKKKSLVICFSIFFILNVCQNPKSYSA